ncbi:Imm74 family immunity protein [Massilia soli]|uniref:Uncharacterized protein n=1 Tax=Massilia soli TaxID=2792854 RepID=A0ABS7SVV5_9BURK|nr:hypothetical protein [Massilia soli]
MISIVKITPSSITLRVDHKTVKVSGESFLRGHGSSDFVINIASISCGNNPLILLS